MHMHGVGLRQPQVQLTHLLTDIRGHEHDGRLPFGHYAFRFLDTIQSGLATFFLMGDSADRIDLMLDIARNQLAVAPYASIRVDEVVRVADSSNALRHRLLVLREALTRMASRFHLLLGLLQSRCYLWGAAGATPPRVCTVTLGMLLHTGAPLFSHRHGLVGCTLCGGHRGSDSLAQLMLHMEKSGE